ncbi:hypothetical protein LCGC14_0741880 [marine sediment metagenome]|uniref:Uncharacterized protein n=1 Tax=marine sediment metagenome TaxID=412755 RepID=A0A0F9QAR2_9ZZZZ
MERKVVFNEDDLPIELCIIIKNDKELCVDIDKTHFHEMFVKKLQKEYNAHWEAIKEKSKLTHTSKLLEKYKKRSDLKGS